jgi:hypothetical protein
MSALRVPAYRRHKARGQAYVNLHGRQIYLGKFDSPESHERYRRLVAELVSRPAVEPLGIVPRSDLSILELSSAFWEHAKGYYVKDGQPTGHLGRIRRAIRILYELYGEIPVAEFGPIRLKAIQQSLVTKKCSRSYINAIVGVIRQIFRWGVAEELCERRPRRPALGRFKKPAPEVVRVC